MALSSTALTTLAAVKDWLPDAAGTDAPRDARIERLINAVSDAADRYVGYSLACTERTERYRGSGTRELVLRCVPVASLTSVEDDGRAVDVSTVRIADAAAGILWRDDGWASRDYLVGGSCAQDVVSGSGEDTIEIVYTAGYVTPAQVAAAAAETPPRALTRTLPHDLEHAVIVSTVAAYREVGTAVDITERAHPLLTDQACAILDGLRRLL